MYIQSLRRCWPCIPQSSNLPRFDGRESQSGLRRCVGQRSGDYERTVAGPHLHSTSASQTPHIPDGDTVTGDARKKLVAVEALKEWKEAQNGLQGKVERRTKQADKLLNEIYQLVGLYSVFVGVVFAAAVQSQKLKCQHIWIPLVLCAFAWLTIFLVTKRRLKKYVALRVSIKSEEKSRAAIYNQISNLKVFGHKGFDFTEHVNENRSAGIITTSKSLVVSGKYLVIQFVPTALTLILAGSFIHIMCLKEITSRL